MSRLYTYLASRAAILAATSAAILAATSAAIGWFVVSRFIRIAY